MRFVFGVCVMIVAALFAGMMFALARRRADVSGPPAFHERAAVDYLWAVIPWLMIIACVVPAARRILASH